MSSIKENFLLNVESSSGQKYNYSNTRVDTTCNNKYEPIIFDVIEKNRVSGIYPHRKIKLYVDSVYLYRNKELVSENMTSMGERLKYILSYLSAHDNAMTIFCKDVEEKNALDKNKNEDSVKGKYRKGLKRSYDYKKYHKAAMENCLKEHCSVFSIYLSDQIHDCSVENF